MIKPYTMPEMCVDKQFSNNILRTIPTDCREKLVEYLKQLPSVYDNNLNGVVIKQTSKWSELAAKIKSRVCMLIVDMQNNLVLEGAPLCVKGAIEDARRLSLFIRECGGNINAIFCTLNSHPEEGLASSERQTEGFLVVNEVAMALQSFKGPIYFHEKGENVFSLLGKDAEAEGRGRELLEQLKEFDEVILVGEASSHCVKATGEDLIRLGIDGSKIKVFKDMTSHVPGHDAKQAEFFEFMEKNGASVMNSKDW
jgi:nicotinamidase-related amidase